MEVMCRRGATERLAEHGLDTGNNIRCPDQVLLPIQSPCACILLASSRNGTMSPLPPPSAALCGRSCNTSTPSPTPTNRFWWAGETHRCDERPPSKGPNQQNQHLFSYYY